MAVVNVEHEAIRFVVGDLKDIGFKEFTMKHLRHDYHVTDFWANDDITFKLKKGDMLGIIGSNGAGKSTLLKAISGVLEPTRGRVTVKGKIAALLELTAGFDNDLSVRENTYLRGALLGYTRSFISEKYDSIIEFSELQEFQDRKYGQLSSGMKSRLAFSVACLVEPDILILDEVLAVGDGAFRRKSEEKIREILSRGITGLLVTHSVGQVRELCNKVLWLDHGQQIAFGSKVETICNAYEEFLYTKKTPKDDEDMQHMSESWIERLAKETARKQEAARRRLMNDLSSKDAREVYAKALEIVEGMDLTLIK